MDVDSDINTLPGQTLSGDEEALGAWFEENVDALYAFVFHRVGCDVGMAEDVTQTTLTEALGAMGSFDSGRGTMQAWLRVRSRNHIRAAMRHRQRNIAMVDAWEEIDVGLEELYRQMAAQPLPDEIVQRWETRQLVGATLASLPCHYRELLEAKYVADESLENIAAARAATTDSIKALLRRARAAFKETFIAIADITEPETLS